MNIRINSKLFLRSTLTSKSHRRYAMKLCYWKRTRTDRRALCSHSSMEVERNVCRVERVEVKSSLRDIDVWASRAIMKLDRGSPSTIFHLSNTLLFSSRRFETNAQSLYGVASSKKRVRSINDCSFLAALCNPVITQSVRRRVLDIPKCLLHICM